MVTGGHWWHWGRYWGSLGALGGLLGALGRLLGGTGSSGGALLGGTGTERRGRSLPELRPPARCDSDVTRRRRAVTSVVGAPARGQDGGGGSGGGGGGGGAAAEAVLPAAGTRQPAGRPHAALPPQAAGHGLGLALPDLLSPRRPPRDPPAPRGVRRPGLRLRGAAGGAVAAVPAHADAGAGAAGQGGRLRGGSPAGAAPGPARPLRQRGLSARQRHEAPAPLLPQGPALQALLPLPRPPLQAHQAQVAGGQCPAAGRVRLRPAPRGAGVHGDGRGRGARVDGEAFRGAPPLRGGAAGPAG